MGYLKKIRDAKIQNGRYDRQERLDCEEEPEPLPPDDYHPKFNEDYCTLCHVQLNALGECDCDREEDDEP